MEAKKLQSQSFKGCGRPSQSLSPRFTLPLPPPSPRMKMNWPFILAVLAAVVTILVGVYYKFLTPAPDAPPPPATQPAQPQEPAPAPQPQSKAGTPMLILWYEQADDQGKEGTIIPFSTLQGIQKVDKKIKKITVLLPKILGAISTFQIRFQKPVSGKFGPNLQGDWEFTPYTPMGTGVYELTATLQRFPNISLQAYLKLEE